MILIKDIILSYANTISMKKRFLSFVIILPVMICALAFLGGWTAPKSVPSAADIDKLMTKWENSNNWVLVENETLYTVNENNEIIKPEHIKPTKTITERNGNVTKRSSNTIGCEVVYIDVFKGENCTTYGYRNDGSVPGWNTGFISPNPSTSNYTIEKYFEKWIMGLVEPTLHCAATLTIREEKGVYYFEGFANMSKRYHNSDFDKPGDVCKSFSYKLAFGTSKAKIIPMNNK